MEANKSSLELMLERIQRIDDRRDEDEPPALPFRPALPPGRRCRPIRGGHVKSRRTNKEDSVYSVHQQNVGEFLLVAVSVADSSIHEFPLTKDCKLGGDDRKIQVIVRIQKCFRAHQARDRYHELKRGIITLQSFMRGEIARKNYQLLVKRQTSAIFLQCALRRFLARKNSSRNENARTIIRETDSNNRKLEDYVKVAYGDVVELQRRVWRAEAELEKKKEENLSLKQQIDKFENKWKQHEAKMISMEKMWQDQLTSIQVTLTTKEQRISITENPITERAKIRLNTIAYFIGQHQDEVDEDGLEQRSSTELNSAPHLGSSADPNPQNELKRLRNKFEEWEREYKCRLRETEANFHKLGKWKVKRKYKWWWER